MSQQPDNFLAREAIQNQEYAARLTDSALAILVCMVSEPRTIGPITQILDSDDFVLSQFRLPYDFIVNAYREGKPVDIALLRDGLKLAGVDENFFADRLRESSANIDLAVRYAETYKEIANLWRLRQLGLDLSQAKALESAQILLDKINAVCVSRPSVKAVTYFEAFQLFCDAHGAEAETPFFPWPIAKINEANRLRHGHIAVLGAYPGVGKTAFALQAVESMCREGPIGYYTFESSVDEVYRRNVARTTLVDVMRIQDNRLTAEDWDEIVDLRKKLAEPPCAIIPAAGMTAEDVISHAMANRYALIVVDYIQHVRGNAKGRKYAVSEYERVTECSMAFQSFAARTGTTILLLSQLSRPQKVTRSVRTADGTRAVSVTPPPTLSSLRSSGQLEQDADVVFLMWREDDEDTASPRRLQISKNRHGPSGATFRLAFDGAHQLFSEMSWREEYGGQCGTRKPAARAARDAAQMSIDGGDDDLPF